MALFPEKEPRVSQRPEEIGEVPPDIEGVVTPTPTTFTKQVLSDSGEELIQTPQNAPVSIEIPADAQTLKTYSKGSVDDARSWWGLSWLRAIQKAIRQGLQIIFRKGQSQNATG